MESVLRIKDSNGRIIDIPALRGPQGFQGEKGNKGDKGDKGDSGYTPRKGIDYFTNQDKNELVDSVIEKANIPVIPDYVIAEAESVIDRVLSMQGDRTFTFAAISDLHYGNANYTEGIVHACQAMKYIDERIKLDAVAVLGDYADSYPEERYEDSINDFKTVNSILSDLRFAPNLRIQGNHDYYENHFSLTHRFIQAQSDDVVWGDKLAGYFYKDFSDYKLRIICLNTVEEGNSNIDCSDKQYEWFARSLDVSEKEDASEWQILILSHHPIDWFSNDTEAPKYWYKLPKILYGYKNGLNSADASGYGSEFTPTFDFSGDKNAARIVGNIHGHIHNLLVSPIYLNIGQLSAGDIGIYRMATPEACIQRSNQYTEQSNGLWVEDISYPKTINTKNDTSFVIYCVDLDTNIINAICYGAGYDREVNYNTGENIATFGITNTLTNISNNNPSLTIREGDNYIATLTATMGDIISVVITMNGKDITNTAYSNGLINIESVTGNIVITAIAEGVVANYSITNNLIDVTSDNSTSIIKSGNSYYATLTADIGDITTVVISMGGKNITDDAYFNGIINIPSVTGDIIITAVATKAAVNYTNQIPISISTDGKTYNGVGYKSDTRLNSGATETGQSGVGVTGFIPVKDMDVVYFKNVNLIPGNDSQNYCYIAFYNSDFEPASLDDACFKAAKVYERSYVIDEVTTDPTTGYLTSFKIVWGEPNLPEGSYMRISAVGLDDTAIITIDEPIE